MASKNTRESALFMISFGGSPSVDDRLGPDSGSVAASFAHALNNGNPLDAIGDKGGVRTLGGKSFEPTNLNGDVTCSDLKNLSRVI